MSTKISQLTPATDITASDLMQIVDVEDGVMAPSGTNKKVTASLLAKELAKQPLEPGIVISGSSSGDAVRITQTGSGNALVVEDSANPDSTPLVINDTGDVLIGQTQNITGTSAFNRGIQTANISSVQLGNYDNTEFGESITFNKSRGTVSSPHVVPNIGDTIGELVFAGSDGTKFVAGASIRSSVDGTPGVDDMPGRLIFTTTADGTSTPVERMRITSAGNVGIGTATPSSKLHVAGDLTMSSATVATSATAGANGDVPAQVAGYLVVSINGTARKIPYYP
jgi:hypothetical protein